MSEAFSANLVRAYCDGELGAEEARAIEQRAAVDPDLAARIRFEQALRKSVERTLSEQLAVPPALQARVHAVLDERVPAQFAGRIDEDGSSPGSSLGPVDDDTDDPAHHVAGPRANVFAIAACLALVAGAVLFGIFGKPIDRMQPTASLLTDVAGYASDEHRRCAASPENRNEKVVWRSPSEAEPRLERYLGTPVSVERLAPAGYRFAGATVQELPGHRLAAHLIYARGERGEDGCPEALLSVFLVPDVGQFDASLAGAAREWTMAGDRPECSKRVLATTDGSLVYFLVCCDESRITALAAAVVD